MFIYDWWHLTKKDTIAFQHVNDEMYSLNQVFKLQDRGVGLTTSFHEKCVHRVTPTLFHMFVQLVVRRHPGWSVEQIEQCLRTGNKPITSI